jgi:HD superfamily phosphohydrolase
MMQIPDPIHGYISLSGMYADIVNTPEFQRLRSVEQGSFRPVYPGARHDRFIHSLGTYHLATKFVEHFFRNLEKDLNIALPADTVQRLKTTFRYAALLHDIGHAPFSHTTEHFFLVEKVPGTRIPVIWDQLAQEVEKVCTLENSGEFTWEYPLFHSPRGVKADKPYIGSAHEIMSALILVDSHGRFLSSAERKQVDLALAARMVIGYTYSPEDPGLPEDAQILQELGVRNCLIQLLNCSVLDVDRLDYMVRDTQMSGYFNAPLDLERLAGSVTAVCDPNLPENTLWLLPAYRDDALSVFDLMFQAKLSHDTWVLANPVGPYEAAIIDHCIRNLHPDYVKEVFCRKALSREGIFYNGKHYRLLSDVDVSADLKERANQGEANYVELYTRENGVHRTAAWRSYFEYHHIFRFPTLKKDQDTPVQTLDGVYDFFKDLLKHLSAHQITIFDQAAVDHVLEHGNAGAKRAALFLKAYLQDIPTNKSAAEAFNVVLLDRTANFTLKIDPAKIYIVFYKSNLPLRDGKYNFSSYAELNDISQDFKRKNYFYLFRHGGLGSNQLPELRRRLIEELK